jgi:hypothetical protein
VAIQRGEVLDARKGFFYTIQRRHRDAMREEDTLANERLAVVENTEKKEKVTTKDGDAESTAEDRDGPPPLRNEVQDGQPGDGAQPDHHGNGVQDEQPDDRAQPDHCGNGVQDGAQDVDIETNRRTLKKKEVLAALRLAFRVTGSSYIGSVV